MIWRNAFGFSALEALIAIAISSVTLMGTSHLILSIQNTESRSEKLFWLNARRTQFQSIIRTDSGWLQILSHNPALNCINSTTGCAAYASPQDLKLPVDGVVVDGANPATGLSAKGDFCSTFNSVAGDPNCPIGMSLKWQVLCDDASCFHGQPRITITFQYNDPNKLKENLSSYNIVAYHDPKLETLNEVCGSMGGTLSGTTCSLPQLSAACDPASGSFALGFSAIGTVICGRPDPGSCASQDAAVGFNLNGGIKCALACP